MTIERRAIPHFGLTIHSIYLLFLKLDYLQKKADT